MAYGFRLKAIASAGLSGLPQGDGESGKVGISLSSAEGSQCFAHFVELDSGRTSISIVGRGFRSEDLASDSGRAARGALRYASLVAGVAVDFGHEPARGTQLSDGFRDRIKATLGEATIIGDAHGLTTWRDDESDELHVVGMRVTGIARVDSAPLIEALTDGLQGGPRLEGSKEALATDLYFLADFETSDRATFLTLVTCLEVLAEQKVQPPDIRKMVRYFKSEAKNRETTASVQQDEASERAYRSLVGSLARLERESISESINSLVRDTLNATPDRFGHVDEDVRLAQRCYAVRSELVHIGRESAGVDVKQLSSDLRKLVRKILRSRALRQETAPADDAEGSA